MQPHYAELEGVLTALIAEHIKLLGQLELQQAAMKGLDLKKMEECASIQEATRMRIATLESRRRMLVSQLASLLRLPNTATLSQLAEANPQMKVKLLALREKLKGLVQQVSSRAHIAGRVAGAVLGHLNTVVRLIAGAVEQAGLYTKQGVPQVSSRIGVMEAIG